MIEYLRAILTGQFEASLCMLNQCVRKCPPEHWEGKIANDTFRQVAYHTLFFVDLYLSPGEETFELRELHHRGGDERSSTAASAGLSRDETLSYVAICRQRRSRRWPVKPWNPCRVRLGSPGCLSRVANCICTTSATCSITRVN